MPVCETSFPYHLTLDGRSQYSLFKKYLLTGQQLTENDFPIEHRLFPGKIYISGLRSRFNQWGDERTCARCNTSYQKNSNPAYCNVKPCYYHSEKYDIQSRLFPCCQTTYWCPCCTLGKHHVSSECHLTHISFKKARSGHNKFPCNVFALDCELVYTAGGLELAKVGIVDVDGNKVYESFVRPEMEILDFNSEYSGITPYILKFMAIPFSQAQEEVLELLTEDSILVGHEFGNDLRAMRLIHKNVVDTSVLFPKTRTNVGDISVFFPEIQTNRTRSLKDLAKEYLNKDIQTATNGYDCVENAKTVMALMLHKINMNLHTDCVGSTQGIWVATNTESDAGSSAQGENSLKRRGTPPQANPLISLSSPDPRVQSMPLPQYFHKGQRNVHRPVDVAKVSFRHGTRNPGAFVQDENDRNFVNTSSRSRRSPDLNTSRNEGSGLPGWMQESLQALFHSGGEVDASSIARENRCGMKQRIIGAEVANKRNSITQQFPHQRRLGLNWSNMVDDSKGNDKWQMKEEETDSTRAMTPMQILGSHHCVPTPQQPSIWTEDGRTWYPDPLSIPPMRNIVHH